MSAFESSRGSVESRTLLSDRTHSLDGAAKASASDEMIGVVRVHCAAGCGTANLGIAKHSATAKREMRGLWAISA